MNDHDELLKPYFSRQTELSVQDGCVLWGNKIIILTAGKLEVLQEIHEASPGSTHMKQLAIECLYGDQQWIKTLRKVVPNANAT